MMYRDLLKLFYHNRLLSSSSLVLFKKNLLLLYLGVWCLVAEFDENYESSAIEPQTPHTCNRPSLQISFLSAAAYVVRSFTTLLYAEHNVKPTRN